MTTIQITKQNYKDIAIALIDNPNKNELNGTLVIGDTSFKYRLIYDYDGYLLLYARFALYAEGQLYYIVNNFSFDELKSAVSEIKANSFL